jgi:hypothetical protein
MEEKREGEEGEGKKIGARDSCIRFEQEVKQTDEAI